MNLSVTVNDQTSARLNAAAIQLGGNIGMLIDKLATEHLPPIQTRMATPQPDAHSIDPANDASIALLQSWLAEDATDDPEEIRIAEEELVEFKRNMNQPRKEAGARLHYPEVE